MNHWLKGTVTSPRVGCSMAKVYSMSLSTCLKKLLYFKNYTQFIDRTLTMALAIIRNFSLLSNSAMGASSAGTTGWKVCFFLLLLGIFQIGLCLEYLKLFDYLILYVSWCWLLELWTKSDLLALLCTYLYYFWQEIVLMSHEIDFRKI